MSDSKFWKQKLGAFLHDPPSKALEIPIYGSSTKTGQTSSYERDSFERSADSFAASADRIPFPHFRSDEFSCTFDGVNNAFHHPLGDGKCEFEQILSSQELVKECQTLTSPEQLVQELPEIERARAEFFAVWRLCPEWLSKMDARYAFLPADPRIPDHSIFLHDALTSAFAGCNGHPALLRFHLGPIQSFIAAARSTRDLWSGSFLLSWLITTGLTYLTGRIGPDTVIFPNLRKQPLFDLLWKKSLWDKLHFPSDMCKSVEKSFQHEKQQLLTPNFPNVFLALVPSERAEDLAHGTENAIREEWRNIAANVWNFAFPGREQIKRYKRQTERHLSISWNVTPFPATLDEAEGLAEDLPDQELLTRFRSIRRIFEEKIPQESRDDRYYNSEGKLNNIGLAWPLIVARNAWELDAVRQTRSFDAWAIGGAAAERGVIRDALNGKEEAIPREKISEKARPFFIHNDPVGTTTLIKRLWHQAYLKQRFGFLDDDFRMPNTRFFAESLERDDGRENPEDNRNTDRKYFAILAFDGDDMGKWVSGAKTPLFRNQLADKSGNGKNKGIISSFEKIDAKDFLNFHRMLTPSYHLQFSEALSNFALQIAPKIVNAWHGRLIYAGGDDVLAMLPASSALGCTNDLQRAFSGEAPLLECGIRKLASGFLAVDDASGRDQKGRLIPIIVPGSKASASVGIAMAHFKEPLQDVVRAAQSAEKRAKQLAPEKNAFAVTVFKHSGEISEWDGSFRNGEALKAFFKLLRLMDDEILSSRFPHRLLELTAPYCSVGRMEDCDQFDFTEAVCRDMALVIGRQKGKKWNEKDGKEFSMCMKDYLKTLKERPSENLRKFSGLLSVAAFLARQGGKGGEQV